MTPTTVGFSATTWQPTVYAGAATASPQVVLSGASHSTITVNYATSDVSAVNGVDYTPESGQLTFQSGQTSATINIPILGAIGDQDNSFDVTLSNPSGATLGTSTQKVIFTVANPVSLTNPGNQSSYDGDSVRLTLSATDALGNALTYSASNLPSGLSLVSGIIVGTVASTADQHGPFSVSVTATDAAAHQTATQTGAGPPL